MYAKFIEYRELTLDVRGYKLLGRGQSVYLSSQQTGLLAVLMTDPNRVQSYRALATALTSSEAMSDKALKTSISRTRRSLGLLGCSQQYVISVRGIGYIFDPTPPVLNKVPVIFPRHSGDNI